jgi:Transposase IS66 family
VVRTGLRQVFAHDEHAPRAPRRPAARLAYPQRQSQPLMDGLQGWRDQQSDDPGVEPNRALGKAMGSLQPHGDPLRRFFSVPGAPRDNPLAERALKLCMRQRHNSRFSTRTPRAYSASVLPSLSAPGLYAGINAVESLVA